MGAEILTGITDLGGRHLVFFGLVEAEASHLRLLRPVGVEVEMILKNKTKTICPLVAEQVPVVGELGLGGAENVEQARESLSPDLRSCYMFIYLFLLYIRSIFISILFYIFFFICFCTQTSAFPSDLREVER